MTNDTKKGCCNIAAIDIGSNAARLLIKSVTPDADGTLHFQKLQFVRFPLRLGVDVFGSGRISEEREARFLRLIKAFRQLLVIYDVAAYRACATSALRDAANGSKILKRIKKKTGISIETISGDEEAQIIYDNHTERLPAMSKPAQDEDTDFLYVDVGGGSTEVSLMSGGKKAASRSFNVGTLRLLGGQATPEDISQMCGEVRQMAHNSKKSVIIGSGGNINKLYRLVPKKSKLKDRITLSQLQKLHTQLSALSAEDRMREFDLRPDRADVIVPAAKIFIAVASAVNAEDIIVPTIGLSDGIINDLALKHFSSTTPSR